MFERKLTLSFKAMSINLRQLSNGWSSPQFIPGDLIVRSTDFSFDIDTLVVFLFDFFFLVNVPFHSLLREYWIISSTQTGVLGTFELYHEFKCQNVLIHPYYVHQKHSSIKIGSISFFSSSDMQKFHHLLGCYWH